LAKWDEAQEKWIIPRIDLAANNNQKKLVRPIPTSVKGAFRPETEFSRRRKLMDKKNPRHNHENILDLTFEYPDPVSINSTEPDVSKEIRIDVKQSYEEVFNTPYIWQSTTKVMEQKGKSWNFLCLFSSLHFTISWFKQTKV
jgi:hypothetical protein